MRRLALQLLTAIVALAPTSHAQRRPAAPSSDIDGYVARAMRTFEVPGVAVTIVKGGKVVVARGYGVRRLGDTARVTPDTRFGIASNSKAFTATALLMLADKGRIAIDSPVVKYLPEFAMSDPYVTARMTVRDLLVHRSGLGLGAGDLLWWPGTTYSRHEIMRRLRYLPLEHGFREAYAYDNVLYLVAGELLEKVTGQSWEDHIQATLLDRLGMRSTTTRHSDAARPGNIAATHAKVEGTLTVIPPLTNDVTNAAGGVNSTANDMAKWMITLLNAGRTADSVELWRRWTQLQLWTGVTPMPVAGDHIRRELREFGMPQALIDVIPRFALYGLGFEVHDYRGHRVITHTGGLPGYVSRVTFVPELHLGISVLTNAESSDAFDAITRRVLDEHLGIGPTDWVALLDSTNTLMSRKRAEYQKVFGTSQATLDSAVRDSTKRPSLDLWKYAGTYEDPWYGTVSIDLTPQRTLVLRMVASPGMVGDVAHWERDVFTIRWRDRALRADAYVWFQLDEEGRVSSARMKAIERDTDFSFDFQDLRLKRLPP
jgi:CubicO group peptidase (beta-lactamase class C family)